MEPQENEPDPWDQLRARILTAAALLLSVLFCLWCGGTFFTALVILAAILLMKEWEPLTLYQMLILRLAGYPYIILPAISLIWMRNLSIPQDSGLGFSLILSLIAVVAATDIGAYFVGKRFGRHKMAPTISPNKSWEGVVGGFAAAIIAGILFLPYTHIPQSFFSAISISILLCALAQLGDLFKSWIKRKAGVKDSGSLLPGHGGVLDRLDGYMFAAPALALLTHHLLS